MARPLVIVESPAKAKTISRFLGGEFDVRASVGHVADLPSKGLAVDVDNGFKPTYELTPRGKDVVKELRAALKDASELYLATDEDREGEAISWHLLEALKPKVPVKRMVFHEITRSAIEHAVANPRGIDYGLVEAAETRRILDRLYGYEVSPVLWRRIKPGLSAGRVQSPSIRLIVQRERERMAFVAAGYWDIDALMATAPVFTATLVAVDGTKVATGKDFGPDGRPTGNVVVLDEAAARGLADGLTGQDLDVRSVEERPYRSSPKAPFMTSTLQQEGGRKLRLSAAQVMRVAQGLYERGFITYMRTDATVLSDEAVAAARSSVSAAYGERFLSPQPRTFTTKVKNAQEAHEAIRPTVPFRSPDEVARELNGQELSLYRMVWQRTLASQMADAHGHHRQRATGGQGGDRHRRRVRRRGHHDHLPRLPPGVRGVGRRGRRDRAGGPAPQAGPGRPGAGELLHPQRPRHHAPGALHRGVAHQEARGPGHRAPVHVGQHHPDHPRPRLRVEEGPGPGAHLDGLRGGEPAGEALRRAGRLRLHGPDGGRPRRHRPQREGQGGVAAGRSTSATTCSRA